MTTVWVPCDAAAVSVGADEVADAFAAAGATVRRNGSRGMLWLEPLVEVETDGVRMGYANVPPADVPDVLAGSAESIGAVEDHEWLTAQKRVTFARVGVIEPTDIAAYQEHGGYAGLTRALAMDPAAVVQEVIESGLRGRGGAGFPTGIKWETVRSASADLKFVACNADEGDSGTFADRMLMEGDPFSLGISGGFSSPLAAELIAGADLIVGVGCALNMGADDLESALAGSKLTRAEAAAAITKFIQLLVK